MPAFSAIWRKRGCQRLANDLHAGGFVAFEFQIAAAVEGFDGADQRHAAAGDDAFLHRGAGGVQGVLDAGFLFLQFRFGGGADVDLGHAAGQLGQAFLQFLAVVVAGGAFDFAADLFDAALDGLGVAGPFDDRRVVVVDANELGLAELVDLDLVQFDAQVFHDRPGRR